MSRVITFSRTFPAHHPKSGQPTYFVEKIWNSIENPSYSMYLERLQNLNQDVPHKTLIDFWRNIEFGYSKFYPKMHTIRAGSRWKVGDMFSPRVWSGKPYNSKQIVIAPDVKIVKVWDFEIEVDKDYICVLIDGNPWHEENSRLATNIPFMETLAKNDGLSLEDMKAWFQWGRHFTGQIICWDNSVNY